MTTTPRKSAMLPGRRSVVGGFAVASAAAALGLIDTNTVYAASASTDPFALGVAAGP